MADLVETQKALGGRADGRIFKPSFIVACVLFAATLIAIAIPGAVWITSRFSAVSMESTASRSPRP